MNKKKLQNVLLLGIFLISCNNSEHEELRVTETGYEKQNLENFISKEDVADKAPNVFAKLAKFVSEAKTTTYSGELTGLSSEKAIEQIFSVKDSEKALNAYYIVTYEGGGFAIIGADERIPEVLAFSEDSDFPFESEEIMLDSENEEVPLGLCFWLNDMKTAVSLLRTQNVNIFTNGGNTVGTYSGGDTGGTGGTGVGIPDENFLPCVLTTKWGQEDGYNQYLPLCSGNQHIAAGCGATAVAQIMKYWEHPSTFDWTNMADTYATTATATLFSDIYNATYSAPASYDNCRSTTQLYRIYNALSNYGYHNTNWFYSFDLTTAKNEISSGRPMLLFASLVGNSALAHCWVTDSFVNFPTLSCQVEEDNTKTCTTHYLCVFHMNWGWSGNYNGWFNINGSIMQTSYTFDMSSLLMLYQIYPN
jgi:hypothetical protein